MMGYTYNQFVIETWNFNKSQNDIETNLFQYPQRHYLIFHWRYFKIVRFCVLCHILGTDHLTCRVGYGFFFVQNFFFGQHELEYFFLSRKARNFFPEFNIRLYGKKSDYFFYSTKIRIFFQQHWESEYLFRGKKPSPLPGS